MTWNTSNARKWFDRFFEANEMNEVRLAPEVYIQDLRKFVSLHLSMCEANNGNARFSVYWNRLRELKTKLKQYEKTNMGAWTRN